MDMQRKVCEAPSLKFFGDEANPAGSVSGYLSSFGNLDRGKEIVVRGAFSKHLDSFLKNGFFALNHNWDILPIGTITAAHEDDFGLHFTADFHSYPAAQEARTVAMERLARGKSVSTSIGYKVADSERTADALLLKDLPLYEGSLVNVPMNPLALISGAKRAESFLPDDDAEFGDEIFKAVGLPDGLTLGDECAYVLAAPAHAISRLQRLIDLRAKEGRVLSAANVSRMRDMAGSLAEHAATLGAMCDHASPKSLPDFAIDAARVELARFLREQSRTLGVTV